MGEYARMAKERPEAFRRHGRRILVIALTYVVLVLLVLGTVIGWGIHSILTERAGFWTTLLTVFAGFSFWAGLRGILSPVDIPCGQRLTREDAPELVRMLDALQSEMGVEKVRTIWVDGEFNASAAQRPVFGLIGMTRCHLTLGVPLLAGLNARELRSVLVHELAHFEHEHGLWSVWNFRMWEAWTRLSESGLAGIFMWPFVALYGGRVLAINSVSRRHHEFQADAREAALVGSEVFAKTMLKVHVLQSHMYRGFLPAFTRETATLESPPSDFMTRAVASIRECDLVGVKAQQCLRLESGERAELEDSHPPTFDRLRALLGTLQEEKNPQEEVKQALRLLEGPSGEAALDILIDDPAKLIAIGDAAWRTKWKSTWNTSRREWLLMADRLEALMKKESSGKRLSVEEAWERVSLATELHGEENARPLLDEFAKCHPSHGMGCLALAMELQREGNGECVEWAKQAAKCDPILKSAAIALRQQWLREHGRFEEAASLNSQLFAEQDALDDAAEEREELSSNSTFEAHDLSAEVVGRLVEQLQGRAIRTAYLVKRKLKMLSGSPQYVLAIKPRRSWLKLQGSDHDRKVVGAVLLEVDFPYDWLVRSIGQIEMGLQLRIRRVAGRSLLKPK